MSPFRLLVIVGPTAVGKTMLAIELCHRFKAEVISADSIQVYRGLNIGSSKPTNKELILAPHHLLDVIDPGEVMNVVYWVKLAEEAIVDIHARGQRVIIAGGAGLYIKALLFGLAVIPNLEKRLHFYLQKKLKNMNIVTLHAFLGKLDPVCAAYLYPTDQQRIFRALEVSLHNDRSFSKYFDKYGTVRVQYPHFILVITRPKLELDIRIEKRCMAMWQKGLLNEVKSLLANGLTVKASSLASLGYRQAVKYVLGELGSEEEAFAAMVKCTRLYAKRQLTWFRREAGIVLDFSKNVNSLYRLIS